MKNTNRKILYIFDAADIQSRIPIAIEAKKRGHCVTLVLIGKTDYAPPQDFEILHLAKPKNFFSALSMPIILYKIIRQQNPHLLHAVTLKYSFLCALACLPFPDLHKLYTIAGLGYLFHARGIKTKILRTTLKPLIILLFSRANTRLIFQNSDDLTSMVDQHYINIKQCTLIRGSGVDLNKFSVFIKPESPPLVLMPTRLVHEKGIHIFIDAARILKSKGIHANFKIAGGETNHNPRAISAASMQKMIHCKTVEWLGRIDDMPTLLAKSTLIVYPSYYGEGIPRVLLEACAAGRAIITTDHTGCREAVTHNLNGLLVPIKNAQATAEAIETLLNDENLRKQMESHSRIRAENEFDITHIAKKTVDLYSIA